MIEFCGRPVDFEKKIKKNLKSLQHSDILIHLGDICMGRDDEMHRQLNDCCMAKRWLLKGNHDKKSYEWYLNHGWSVVSETMMINLYGEKILLSHKPHPLCGASVNIYGHFHNNPLINCEPELTKILTSKHYLFCLENLDYQPIPLEKFLTNQKKKV